MKKVTKQMVNRAEAAHFRTESRPSLIRHHALSSIYYKQRGNLKVAKQFLTSEEVKKKVKMLEGGKSKKPKRRIVRRRQGVFNFDIGL